ncbi:hypothetical protein RRG08_030371 [Elysia crispata]|uniref:PiggyBac transposable element-derived protein domain-containing protein n=1 Tax=Elysia crispata TaxID=231223 RepID=A0AAE0YG79_9GAST|nr:hypothetical protein RRG08_030371 [Elysia crispata]
MTVAGMKAWLCAIVRIGLDSKDSDYMDCWSKDDSFRKQGLANLMEKNRYETINQYFHRNDSYKAVPHYHPEHDPIFKVCLIIENFCQQFVDAIDRETNHIQRMEVMRGDGTESDDDSIVQAPTVDLNAPAQWIADPNGFVPQEQLQCTHNIASQAGNPDRLAKLRPMNTHFNEVFNNNYTPYLDVSIDESMVTFKSCLAFHQYMPGKPIKWGVKVWALYESTTGYMSCFQVYTGREAGQEQRLAHGVVKDLMAPFHHTGMRVYMDNFYTGAPLLRDLSALGVEACGTVRSNRNFMPADLLPKKVQLQKHQYKTTQAGHLTFSVWLDTKDICVLSNFHDPAQTGTVSRRSGLQEQQQIVVPLALADYQSHMMGVDLTNNMIGY